MHACMHACVEFGLHMCLGLNLDTHAVVNITKCKWCLQGVLKGVPHHVRSAWAFGLPDFFESGSSGNLKFG